MSWRGDPFASEKEGGIGDVFGMLDRLEDRRQAMLFQPNKDLPFLYFGRLASWSMSGARPFEISASFETDGMGQTAKPPSLATE